MSISVQSEAINEVWSGTAGTTIAVASVACAAGDIVVVFVTNDDGSGATVTVADGTNGSYGSVVQNVLDTSNGQRLWAFRKENVAAATVTVTATYSSSSSFRAIHVAVIRGGAVSSALVGSSGNFQSAAGTGTDAVTSGNANVTAQPALLYGFCMNASSTSSRPAVGTGFSAGTALGWDNAQGGISRSESKRTTATGNQAATFTNLIAGPQTTSIVMAFQELVALATGFGETENPRPFRKRPTIPENTAWDQAPLAAFAPAAWFGGSAPERAARARRAPESEPWSQSPPTTPLSGAWLVGGAPERRPGSRRAPENEPWAQTALATALSGAGFLSGTSPERRSGPRRAPFFDGGDSAPGALFVYFEGADNARRPPRRRAPPETVEIFPSAFPFAPSAGFVAVDAAAPAARARRRASPESWDQGPIVLGPLGDAATDRRRGARSRSAPESWDQTPLSALATTGFLGEDGARPRRGPRPIGEDGAAQQLVLPAGGWFVDEPSVRRRARRAPGEDGVALQLSLPAGGWLVDEPTPRRRPRRGEGDDARPIGSPYLGATGWELDPVVPPKRRRRPGEDVSSPGTSILFLAQPFFESPEPLPRYERPLPGETAGPVGDFIVVLSGSALDDQPGRVPPRRRPQAGDSAGPVGDPIVSLLPFFDSPEISRARAARPPRGGDERPLVLFVPPALAEEPAAVRRRALRVIDGGGDVVGDRIAALGSFPSADDAARARRGRVLHDAGGADPGARLFVAAGWEDLSNDPAPRPRRQGLRAPDWASWPEATFVPPVLGAWTDLFFDPLPPPYVGRRDVNPEWMLAGLTAPPSPTRPISSLVNLGAAARPGTPSLFSLSLQQMLRALAADEHARATRGQRSFSAGPPVALALGGLSSVRLVVVEPLQGALSLILTPASGAPGVVPLSGPIVWRAPLGSPPLLAVSIAGTGSARWLLAGD